MLDLNDEQKRAYLRFIQARDKVGLTKSFKRTKHKWITHRDYLDSVKEDGRQTPLFISNDDWLEYKEASLAWWDIEPEFRKTERMSMSRGDYGTQDSWEDEKQSVSDLVSELRRS